MFYLRTHTKLLKLLKIKYVYSLQSYYKNFPSYRIYFSPWGQTAKQTNKENQNKQNEKGLTFEMSWLADWV